DAILRGEAAETLWLLEHPAVVTTGRRAVPDLDRTALAARGIPVVSTRRGGLATWHGPGQLVAYILYDAGRRGLGPKNLVAILENTVIAWLGERDVDAGRRPGLPGVWVGHDKICAVGLHFSRGVSMHGLALNLCPDLSAFSLFSPCGISDGGITSLQGLRGRAPSPKEAAFSLGPALVGALFRDGVDASGRGQ
ncbi:MAG: lipoyl(octanoyl) transferase LipB, partial [Oligoflexia bacterium]|nr:lipoyl(octanoyl) transferase LipB [Oligoflexia bacterium]